MSKEVIKTSKNVVDCVKQQTKDMKEIADGYNKLAKLLNAYKLPNPGAVILNCFKRIK